MEDVTGLRSSLGKQVAETIKLQSAKIEELEAELAKARKPCLHQISEPEGEYPALPEPRHRGPAATGSYFDAFTADQMRAYVDADRAMRAQAAPAAVAGPLSEHYDEVRATLTGLHSLCENVSAQELRIGPLGSHARVYTWKITAALRHLDALAAAPTTQAAPHPAVQQMDDFWPVDGNASRKQLIEQIGQMNFRLTALRQENAGLVARVQGQAKALRNYQTAAAPTTQELPATPPKAITAMVMQDDSTPPAYCLMVAYRKKRDAMDALAMLVETKPAPTTQQEPYWEGAEEWEKLAWHLCAEENGEDACNDLIWEGGPIPEPWGDRWLKYEGEARRMIALVRTHVPALQPIICYVRPGATLQDRMGMETCAATDAGAIAVRADGTAVPQQEAQKPYAYAVYFPDQPTVELVHDLDDLTDDLTNREHQITKLYATPQEAPTAIAVPSDLVTRESAMRAIEHVAIHNSSYREREAVEMLAEAPTMPPVTPEEFSRDIAELTGTTQPAPAALSDAEDAHALLQEVAACFTRDDDLPDNLLPRIDAVLAARKKGANHD